MQKWEYQTMVIGFTQNDYELLITAVNYKKLASRERLDPYLTQLGQQGWELVGQSYFSVEHILYTFKRPSP